MKGLWTFATLAFAILWFSLAVHAQDPLPGVAVDDTRFLYWNSDCSAVGSEGCLPFVCPMCLFIERGSSRYVYAPIRFSEVNSNQSVLVNEILMANVGSSFTQFSETSEIVYNATINASFAPAPIGLSFSYTGISGEKNALAVVTTITDWPYNDTGNYFQLEYQLYPIAPEVVPLCLYDTFATSVCIEESGLTKLIYAGAGPGASYDFLTTGIAKSPTGQTDGQSNVRVTAQDGSNQTYTVSIGTSSGSPVSLNTEIQFGQILRGTNAAAMPIPQWIAIAQQALEIVSWWWWRW